MELKKHGLTFELTVKELDVWLTSLRHSATRADRVRMIPWDSCPFFRQHRDLCHLTGFAVPDHERMAETLAAENEGKQP